MTNFLILFYIVNTNTHSIGYFLVVQILIIILGQGVLTVKSLSEADSDFTTRMIFKDIY